MSSSYLLYVWQQPGDSCTPPSWDSLVYLLCVFVADVWCYTGIGQVLLLNHRVVV